MELKLTSKMRFELLEGSSNRTFMELKSLPVCRTG